MMAIGVANPSAHGQAMINTATAFTKACASRGCGPTSPHTKNVRTATPITAGTNQAATLSARRCIGARLRCAWLTNCTMRASIVALPTRSARRMNEPVPFTVPQLPCCLAFATGIDSPVIIDSSTELLPSTTRHRPALAPRSHPQLVADMHEFQRNVFLITTAVYQSRRLRAQIQQSPNRRTSPAARAQLEHLAEQNQRCDCRRRLEVHVGPPPIPRNDSGKICGNAVATRL